MKSMMRKVSGVAILLLASGIPLLGAKDSSFTVPVTGSNGFTGTATINGFVNQGGHIVAVGFVANSARTAFAGVVWQQVTLTADTGGPWSGAQRCPSNPNRLVAGSTGSETRTRCDVRRLWSCEC